MTTRNIGRALIAASAVSTITIPIGVDGVLLARAHMNNPRWLPHAKLHCAMSFLAAISLGIGSLALLRSKNQDAATLSTATFLATAFWIGLVAAGLWRGTSYGFAGDPALADMQPPKVWGVTIDPNVALAVVSTSLGWLGFRLATEGDGGG